MLSMQSFDKVDELIPRAEIFRSKLIEDFQLLSSFDRSTNETPKYYSNELSDSPEEMIKMLKENPHSLIRFQLYTSKGEMTYEDRRLNRVKTKNAIPFGPWAKMVVENQYFQNLMLVLILSNSIVLGIQAEITHMDDNSIEGLKLCLNIFDYLSMMIFILDILLKWVDEFWDFWKNGWNNFDFLVTIMSLLPELIKLASGDMATEELAVVAENLRVFRILRSLKMVSRFAQLRIIVLTILKAFKSMVFILTLLGVFMYIFAVAGTVMFSKQTRRDDLQYKDSFSTLGQSLATLFQLFTLDHWFDVLSDLSKVSDEFTSKCYVILWICIGAFIFRNIFAGIMVMNFQNIRADFAIQCTEKEIEMEQETNEKLLEAELAIQHTRNSIADSRRQSVIHQYDGVKNALHTHPELPIIVEGDSSEGQSSDEDVDPAEGVTDQNAPTSNQYNQTSTQHTSTKQVEASGKQSHATKTAKDTQSARQAPTLKAPTIDVEYVNSFNKSPEFPESATWNNTVRVNLSNLANNTKETLWPRDTLFQYYQLMESLQDNLAERHQLQRLLALAISNMHDKSGSDTAR